MYSHESSFSSSQSPITNPSIPNIPITYLLSHLHHLTSQKAPRLFHLPRDPALLLRYSLITLNYQLHRPPTPTCYYRKPLNDFLPAISWRLDKPPVPSALRAPLPNPPTNHLHHCNGQLRPVPLLYHILTLPTPSPPDPRPHFPPSHPSPPRPLQRLSSAQPARERDQPRS